MIPHFYFSGIKYAYMSKIANSFPGKNDLNRCSATTSKGLRCDRDKTQGTPLCNLHQGKIAAKTKKGSGFYPLYGNQNKNFGISQQELQVHEVTNPPYWIIPGFDLDIYRQNNYCIIMIDPDASSQNSPSSKQYLHWLVVNHHTLWEDDLKSNTVIPYTAPSILLGSGLHRYIFYILRQSVPMTPVEINQIQSQFSQSRSNYNIDDFVGQYNLKLIDQTYFTIMH